MPFPVDASKILKKALQNGGDWADLFFEKNISTSIVSEDKKIESLLSGVDSGIGLRVLQDFRTFYGSTNEISNPVLMDLAASISSSVGNGKKIRSKKLKDRQAELPSKLHLPSSINLERKVELVKRLDPWAWSLSPHIVQIRLNYGDSERQMELFHSGGEHVNQTLIQTIFAVTVTVSDGKQFFTGYESVGGFRGYEMIEEENLEEVIRKAVSRAELNMKADRARGGPMTVVISSEAGGTFVHEAVGHGLEADLVTQDMSVYEGQIGETVASPLVNIVDDPTVGGKRGSYFFDDEGTPAQRTVLIENGVLRSYMTDRLTALRLKTNTNGHGRRESYAHKPIVRMSNTMMLPGKDDPDSILRSVSKGLFVKMMGGGQLNTVNGDFVFEVVEGYRIENGKIGEPVRGATLTGNGPEVLKSIDRVGNDLGFSIGTCGKDGQGIPVTDAMPTVRIPELVVGGLTG